MAKDQIHRKPRCDQNWMARNLYSFQQKQRLKTTCSSCILFHINVSALAQVFNCRFMRSTRFGAPLNLLAIGHQTFSIPCVICQSISCRRTCYFFVFFININPLYECAETKGFCVVFNSRSYLTHIS